MDKILIFDYMNKDDICAHVEANFTTGKVIFENYTDVPHRMFFANRPPNIENVLLFFSQRCFPESRHDCKELLRYLGLREYSPIDIVKKTHGVMTYDYSWVRFNGENLCYNDVKIK